MPDYLPVPKGQPCAAFDLDGCLNVSPSKEPVPDPHYWDRHFNNPDVACTPEMIELARALIGAGWWIYVITARPERYRPQTQAWCMRMLGEEIITAASLFMRPDDAYRVDPHFHAGRWKAEQIRALIEQGHDVRFAVEDYKPNADVIRLVVPVLLYEAKRA